MKNGSSSPTPETQIGSASLAASTNRVKLPSLLSPNCSQCAMSTSRCSCSTVSAHSSALITTLGCASRTMVASSSPASRQLSGCSTSPARPAAKYSAMYSAQFRERTAKRSPFSRPSPRSPLASRRTRASNSTQVSRRLFGTSTIASPRGVSAAHLAGMRPWFTRISCRSASVGSASVGEVQLDVPLGEPPGVALPAQLVVVAGGGQHLRRAVPDLDQGQVGAHDRAVVGLLVDDDVGGDVPALVGLAGQAVGHQLHHRLLALEGADEVAVGDAHGEDGVVGEGVGHLGHVVVVVGDGVAVEHVLEGSACGHGSSWPGWPTASSAGGSERRYPTHSLPDLTRPLAAPWGAPAASGGGEPPQQGPGG